MFSRLKSVSAGSWSILSCLVLLATTAVGRGEVTSADWLPAETKLHFSVVDYPTVRPLFEQTGVGRLLRDEAMLPFLKDVPRQLRARAGASWLGLMWVDLGVDWERFAEVPSGEVAWSVFDVDGRPTAMLCADVAGKGQQVQQLRDEIATAMKRQQVEAQQVELDGTTITRYELPARDNMGATTLVHFVRADTFIATHDEELAKRMIPRVGVEQPDNLSGLASYQHVLKQCNEAAQADAHAVLYLVPFDCIEMTYRVAEERDVETERSPEVYRSQGFDALAAIGATFHLKEADSDFRFIASLFAPKPWSKSMQMIDVRNGPLALQNWIGEDVASLTMLNLHAPSVYGNLGPFFDEVVADKAWGTWDDLLAALRDDEDGPQLDLENEILAHLKNPAFVMETESLPATPLSPQVLLAFQTSDPRSLKAGVQKAMQDDPFIETKEIGGETCYYSMSQDNEDELLWAMAVAQGHLLMANDFAILTPVMEGQTGRLLQETDEFQVARASWRRDFATDPSTAAFYQLDRWLQVRYELLRAGKQVASRKTFSGMVNGFFGGEPVEEEAPTIDGSLLPPFSEISKYFGTLDAALVTVDDGWLVSGHLRQ